MLMNVSSSSVGELGGLSGLLDTSGRPVVGKPTTAKPKPMPPAVKIPKIGSSPILPLPNLKLPPIKLPVVYDTYDPPPPVKLSPNVVTTTLVADPNKKTKMAYASDIANTIATILGRPVNGSATRTEESEERSKEETDAVRDAARAAGDTAGDAIATGVAFVQKNFIVLGVAGFGLWLWMSGRN